MSRAPLTAKGAEKLSEELKRLKTVERPRIIEAVAEARAHGDLKENAEYHAAREEHGLNEARIKFLEATISNAQIIDVSSLNVGDKVVFGATVELEDDDENIVKYQIVGDVEADIDHGQISISSPIARALIGKEVDDEIEVQTPGGIKTYYLVSVEYK
ncbi:MAG TPA: transcription elongation factor GreA [Gammaproteobacteria bacterium]|jgi:transcription elongation factor GreA|nr:transcription elongation factor GreA [Xanthomonadales bacterium]MCB1595337.1 transcription elongation factor GreA [Xanthomonadales bacterium]HPI96714.1 transcription elongation factor GreA [Gammaproteobacteria bacterium]HPQ88142.1 transcription elongation factor GreA [Gammaproteobacteria bacterium]